MTLTHPQILIHQLSYTLPNSDKIIFAKLNLALSSGKIGLIGRNGIGKSTLLQLITGERVPDEGSIEIIGTLAYCPQGLNAPPDTTVADVLGITPKLSALSRIDKGSLDDNDYLIIADDWLIEERTIQQLTQFGLAYLPFDQSIHTLSGGEKTRLLLANVFLKNPEFLLLDEPTNNLDQTSRHFLYDAITHWNKGLIVVSHDRALLHLMTQIVEINTLGIASYGGNYHDYEEQKKIAQDAAQQTLSDAKKAFTRTQSTIQTTKERGEQKKSYGRKLFLSGKVDKLTARSRQGRSEKTQARLSKQNEALIENAVKNLDQAKSKIEITQEICVDLPMTYVPNGKRVIEIEQLYFHYPNQKNPLIDHFNLTIVGPERIALLGNNGSGKTTLIKMILGQQKPLRGNIYLGVQPVKYLDQNANSLNPELSILDNFLQQNADSKRMDAYHALAQFLFRNQAACQLVKNLSGGEKLRAELACALMAKQPPQLLILDEPTNHLDFESIASIESALKNYQGAMIVISHDSIFLDNINIGRFIYAPFIST